MRVLKRHSDDSASVDGDDTAETTQTTETAETAESRRPRLSERLTRSRRTDAEAVPAPATTDEGGPGWRERFNRTRRTDTEGQPAADEGGPAWRQRFRRNVTVPVTVPRRAVRQTVTVPGRRVDQPVVEQPSWNVASILAIVAGGALAVVGIVALIRTGIDETWFRPRTEVLDANHTPLLGAVEIGAGAVLLLLGLIGNRVLIAMAGIAGALVCTAAAVEPDELSRLAIEPWWATVLAAVGVVLTLSALYKPAPRVRRDAVIDVH